MGRWVAVSFAAVLLVIAVDTADGHLFGRRRARSAACYTCPIPQCPPADACLPVADCNPCQDDLTVTPENAADADADLPTPAAAAEAVPELPPAVDPTSPSQSVRAEESASESSGELVDRPFEAPADPLAGRDAADAPAIPEAPEYGDTIEVPRYSAQPEPITPTIGGEPSPPIAVETEPEPKSDAGRYGDPLPAATNDVLSELFGPADDTDEAEGASNDQETSEQEPSDEQGETPPQSGPLADLLGTTDAGDVESDGGEQDADTEEADAAEGFGC